MTKPITEFGKYCRVLRLEKGLTMQTIAERMGYSQPQISQVENGTTGLSFEYVMACLKGYDLQDTEKVGFLVKALSCTPQMALALQDITVIPQDALLRLLACLVLNYEPPPLENEPWTKKIRVCIDVLKKPDEPKKPPYILV